MPTIKADKVRIATSRVGNATRTGDPEQIAGAYRELHVARILRAASGALDGDHPITLDQRAELARYLLAGGDK